MSKILSVKPLDDSTRKTAQTILTLTAGLLLGVASASAAVFITMDLMSASYRQAPAHDRLNRQAVRELAASTVDQRLAEAGLTGDALETTMEKAIIAFIKSRATQPGTDTVPQTRPADASNIDAEPIDPATEPVAGNPNARYQLIVYSDYECPFCQRFDTTLETVIERYGDQLAVTLRDYPLPFHGEVAVREAVAAQCAFRLAGDAAFWSYSHAIFDQTRSSGRGIAGATPLADLAVETGLERAAFTQCLNNAEDIRAGIQADLARGQAVGVGGTPTSVLLDTRTGRAALVTGAQPLSAMTSALDNLTGEPAGSAP